MPDATQKQEAQRESAMITLVGSHPVLYGVLAIVAVGALLFFVAIAPAVRALQPAGSSSVADARARFTAAEEEYNRQADLVDAAARISAADRQRIAATIPSEADVPAVVVQIGAMTRAAGVTLQGIDLTAPDATLPTDLPPSMRVLDIALNLGNASYERIKLFMNAVESNLRLMDMRAFTLAPGSGAANVEMRAYFLNESQL